MEPLDPLDQLLRGRAAVPLADRVRAAMVGRLPWVVAGLVVVGVVVAVLVLRPSSTPANLTLPKAGSEPAGGTSAVASGESGGESGSPSSVATTTVSTSLVVHVAGAVLTPGLVALPAGSRVADAVAAAGGLRADADGDRINLAAPVADGVRVFIPVVGQGEPVAVAPVAPAGGPSGPGSTVPAGPVDINRASADELETLPGVGPATSAAIIAYREEHGSFRSVDELQEVRGIGPAKFEALEPAVTVGP